MSSYASVANRAAIAVGTSARLTAPGENTVLGRAVAAVWDLERKAALRAASWNCATKRASLPKLAAAPVHGYDGQFELPTDCLKLLEVCGTQRLRYRLEGRKILADASGPLDILYLRDVTEPAEFDPGFALAFALRIALAIGRKIAGSAFDKDRVTRDYNQALADAQSADALENPPIEQEESDWVLARFAGQGGVGMGEWVDGGT